MWRCRWRRLCPAMQNAHDCGYNLQRPIGTVSIPLLFFFIIQPQTAASSSPKLSETSPQRLLRSFPRAAVSPNPTKKSIALSAEMSPLSSISVIKGIRSVKGNFPSSSEFSIQQLSRPELSCFPTTLPFHFQPFPTKSPNTPSAPASCTSPQH
ncbi:hypothetical protein NA56DRAFT_206336 [Hyaloscypha hepaticicola]|uniref:Uncharacterized protein n=1 Tax=Hyaloscypha hepaticicola TaxID=2082293 RepID=A0A2J6PYZ2_9HELO|nr:hypothetical protein NA56DRAFT_206336 [Hyaloscypha hepaticicola]